MKPFETYLLDAVLARRRQENERQRLVVLNQAIEWLEIWGEQYGIDQAYLFGSITRPHCFTKDSDVDIAVEQIEPDCFFAVMAALFEFLGREVDLIELSKCHFADRIRQGGIVWRKPT